MDKMNKNDIIYAIMNFPGFWTGNGPHNDVVLSSRIRLARNIDDMPFPNKLFDDDFVEQKKVINKFVRESCYKKTISAVDLNELNNYEKRYLRERNLITDEMESSDKSLVLINSNNDFSVLVNEEDHFRIQVIKPGLQIIEAYQLADEVDDELNKYVNYAFSSEYGYLSACPSNLGTGLRVSVFLHLPVITMKKRINEVTNTIKGKGVEIKGTIGHGARTIGSIYQVTNRGTLGNSEIDIIESMDSIINTLILIEDTERDNFMAQNKIQLEDIIWRSFGVLRYSKKMNYVEAMDHLSNIRLGVILAIIKNNSLNDINDLMVNIQWSHLQNHYNTTIKTSAECDELRSDYIKNILLGDMPTTVEMQQQ